MNLHDIVRKSITAVHADKPLTLIKYEGLKGNFQPDDVKDTYINNTVENETTYRLYVYADEVKALNIFKAQNKGNDFIICDDLTYKVIEIIEDFSQDLWLCVRVSLQSEPIDFNFIEDVENE